MLRAYELIVDWDGGDTRKQAASIEVKCEIDAFDDGKGVFVQVRPGGGDWYEIESILECKLNKKEFALRWKRTGGQNHTIWLILSSGTVTKEQLKITQSGPIRVTNNEIKEVPLDD